MLLAVRGDGGQMGILPRDWPDARVNAYVFHCTAADVIRLLCAGQTVSVRARAVLLTTPAYTTASLLASLDTPG